MAWRTVRDLGRGEVVVSAAGLLLTAYACAESSESRDAGAGGSNGSDNAASTSATSGGTSATSATDGGASATSTTDGSRAGAGGGTGEGGEGGAAGGLGGESCEDAEPPEPACEYPESPGGGSEGAACGVTSGLWYGLADSSPTTWPERDVSDWSNGIGVPTIAAKWGGHQVAFDAQSFPAVSWQEEAGPDAYALRVRRWDGATWNDLESRVSAVRREVFDLGVDSAGRVLVAERTPDSVNVVRYEDSAWVTLGEWSATPQVDYLLQMALDDADRPTILDNDAGLRVRRWTSSAWEELGLPGVITLSGAQTAALALRPSGDPVVAWINGSSVRLKQWEGGSWEELEGSATGAGLGTSDGEGVALGIDATDRFVVAWSGQYRVWDGNTWSSTGEAGGNRPRLARSSEGTLYLLTDGDTVRERLLYRWEADTWEPLTELLAEYNEGIDLAVAGDGRLGVASGYDYVRYGDYAEDSWSEQQTVAGAEVQQSRGSLQAGSMLVTDCVASMWNGASWDVVAAPTRAKDCAFSRNADGVVHIAFWTHDNDDVDTSQSVTDLRVARFTLDGWFLLGDLDVVNTDDNILSSSTKLDFDAEGNPVVAWLLEDEAAYGGVARWNGSEWVHWHRPLLGDEPESFLLAVTHDSRPVLSLDIFDGSWQRRQVIEWTGEAWHTSTAASRDRETDPLFPNHRLVIDEAGDPVLTWISDSGVGVLKQVGSEWKQLTPTEDVLEGLAPVSRVHAWSGGGEVFAHYFADCSWHGLSSSNYGGGVSNSVTNSTAAQVEANESEVCVAWTEQIDEGDRVLVRCHEW